MEHNRPVRPATPPRPPMHGPGATTRAQSAPLSPPPPIAPHVAHHHPTPPPKPTKSNTGTLIGLICLVAITVTVVGYGLSKAVSGALTSSAVKSSSYQAVFLNNNMVYFGKLTDVGSDYVKLTDVYYLQVQSQGQAATQNQSQAQAQQNQKIGLTKLGGEIHGPEDAMLINSKEILFWENLKNDSKVVNAIKDYQSGNSK